MAGPAPDDDPSDGGKPLPFAVIYSYDSRYHLATLTAAQRSLVFDRVDEQLVHQPDFPTRHRKPLNRANSIAMWELRIGDLRVFYDLDQAARRVQVVAIGEKKHNILTIGGEEVEL